MSAAEEAQLDLRLLLNASMRYQRNDEAGDFDEREYALFEDRCGVDPVKIALESRFNWHSQVLCELLKDDEKLIGEAIDRLCQRGPGGPEARRRFCDVHFAHYPAWGRSYRGYRIDQTKEGHVISKDGVKRSTQPTETAALRWIDPRADVMDRAAMARRNAL